MKQVFPYEPSRYMMGLILSVLFGITIALCIGLLDGNRMSFQRADSIIKTGFMILTPLLFICSISRRFWICIMVVLLVVLLWSIIAILVLVPKAPDVSIASHFWRCKSAVFTPLFVYILPAFIFQRFCSWCRITNTTGSRGGKDE